MRADRSTTLAAGWSFGEGQVGLTDIRVLIVDDNEDALEVFTAALEQCGANVLTARNARDALTILKAMRVDALVSDLAMPGEDGLWLVQQLRRLKSDQGGSIRRPSLASKRS